jgi:hypothetical protein
MERKKALVEVDEGPFAKAKSMMDLDEERRRVGSGEVGKGDVGEEGMKNGRMCRVGCVIM